MLPHFQSLARALLQRVNRLAYLPVVLATDAVSLVRGVADAAVLRALGWFFHCCLAFIQKGVLPLFPAARGLPTGPVLVPFPVDDCSQLRLSSPAYTLPRTQHPGAIFPRKGPPLPPPYCLVNPYCSTLLG